MKRDMDLCRKILFEVEKASYDYDRGIGDFKVDNYDSHEVGYHVMLLNEAGLIQARNINPSNVWLWVPVRLTWEGHEFLDAARDNKRWEKAKSAMSKFGGFTLDIMKQLLIQYMKEQLNLV